MLIVIVFVLTASDGGVVGLPDPLDELGPELLLHALSASATTTAAPTAVRSLPVLICIATLDSETPLGVTSGLLTAVSSVRSAGLQACRLQT